MGKKIINQADVLQLAQEVMEAKRSHQCTKLGLGLSTSWSSSHH